MARRFETADAARAAGERFRREYEPNATVRADRDLWNLNYWLAAIISSQGHFLTYV